MKTFNHTISEFLNTVYNSEVNWVGLYSEPNKNLM